MFPQFYSKIRLTPPDLFNYVFNTVLAYKGGQPTVQTIMFTYLLIAKEMLSD